jgi:hypothetical protein
MSNSPQSISLAGEKFNELDNWLGIMDVDPPSSTQEKRAMYERLMEILEIMFEPNSVTATTTPVNRRQFHRDMRKIIER